MVSYRVDGKILRLTISGEVEPHERRVMFEAIRSDPKVPDGAVLLIDARESGIAFKNTTVESRLAFLLDGLGPKFSRVCAFIEPIRDPLYGKAFQRAGERQGVHIGLFKDEAEALRWLAPYKSHTADIIDQEP